MKLSVWSVTARDVDVLNADIRMNCFQVLLLDQISKLQSQLEEFLEAEF